MSAEPWVSVEQVTSQENLRSILQAGEGALFANDDLLTRPSFGPAYWLARHLLPEFNAGFLSGLAQGLAQFLMVKKVVTETSDAAGLETELPRLRHALKVVNAYYVAASVCLVCESICRGVLTAFIYFALGNEGRQLFLFTRRIESNRLDRLSPVTTTCGLGYYYLNLALTPVRLRAATTRCPRG